MFSHGETIFIYDFDIVELKCVFLSSDGYNLAAFQVSIWNIEESWDKSRQKINWILTLSSHYKRKLWIRGNIKFISYNLEGREKKIHANDKQKECEEKQAFLIQFS